jgi:phosphoglycerate kinase
MFKTLKDFDFKDQRVLVRVDFNVPQDEVGNVEDDWKIRKSIPTIKYLLDHKAKQVVLMSHLGRPSGKSDAKFKMDKIADKLSELLKKKVLKLNDCINEPAPEDEKIILLENLRFYKAEEANDRSFAKALAEYGDIYVNDAFGTCHRAHASVAAITNFLPACAGLLLEEEVEHLSKALDPERPAVSILGFAKISDKLALMKALLDKMDFALVGGAVVFTFLKSKGFEVGKSLVEDDELKTAKSLLDQYEEKIILPVDIVVADKKEEDANTRVVSITDIPVDMIGLDIGPETVSFFKKRLSDAKTVIWNGPLGMFEIEKFAAGSKEISKYLANSKKTTIIGGGETAEMIRKFGLDKKVTHVSTGGGASLEFLEGKEMPGIKALEENAEMFD